MRHSHRTVGGAGWERLCLGLGLCLCLCLALLSLLLASGTGHGGLLSVHAASFVAPELLLSTSAHAAYLGCSALTPLAMHRADAPGSGSGLGLPSPFAESEPQAALGPGPGGAGAWLGEDALYACAHPYSSNVSDSDAFAGLAASLSAVDPHHRHAGAGDPEGTASGGWLHLVDSTWSGEHVLATAPLHRRHQVVHRAFPSSEEGEPISAMAMTVGLPHDLEGGDDRPSPVLVLTSSPALSLLSLQIEPNDAATGVPALSATIILSASDMSDLFATSHAVSGVLLLHEVAREVYWIGLSSRTNKTWFPAPGAVDPSPEAGEGEWDVDPSALILYAARLNPDGSATDHSLDRPEAFPLRGCADVLSMHHARDLNALLFVTSTDVRYFALPDPRENDFGTQGLLGRVDAPEGGAIVTLPIASHTKVRREFNASTGMEESFITSLPAYDFAEQLDEQNDTASRSFDAAYASSRWVPLPRLHPRVEEPFGQLLLGVQMRDVDGEATEDATYSVHLLSLEIALGRDGSLRVRNSLSRPVEGSLPLMFEAGIAPLVYSRPIGTERPVLSAAPDSTNAVVLEGPGFGQALVRSTLRCELTWADQSGTPIEGMNSSAVPAVFITDGLVAGVIPDLYSIACPIPPSLLTSPLVRTVWLSVTALGGSVRSVSPALLLDVDECSQPSHGGCPAFPASHCYNGASATAPRQCVCGAGFFASDRPLLRGESCTQCPKDSFKMAEGNQAACMLCPTGGVTHGPGSDSSADCTLEDPCADGEEFVTLAYSRALLTPWDAVRQRQLRVQIARDVGLISPAIPASSVSSDHIARIVLDADAAGEALPLRDTGDPLVVQVGFRFLPPSSEALLSCRNAVGAGNATNSTQESAAALLLKLQAQQLSSSGSVTADRVVMAPMSGSVPLTTAECAAAAMIPLLILAGSLGAIWATWAFCPCRSKFGTSARVDPIPLRARSWELFPSFVPLVALGFDVFFVVSLQSVAEDISPMVTFLAVAILAGGLAHNLLTLLWYGSSQLRSPDVGAAGQRAGGKAAATVGVAEEREFDAPQPGQAKGLGSKVSPADPGDVPNLPVQGSLPLWMSAHPHAKYAALACGVGNIASLALWSSHLSSRSSLWDLGWDHSRAGSRPLYKMIQEASVRQLTLRQIPMLLLQGWVVHRLECSVFGAVPILAGSLAMVVVVVRCVLARALPESYPVQRGLAYGKGARKVRENGLFEESEMEEYSEEVSSNGSSSLSRSVSSSSSSSLRVTAAAGDVISAPRPLHSPSQAGEEGLDPSAPLDLAVSAAEEAWLASQGCNVHAWHMVPGAMEQMFAGEAYVTKRIPRAEVERILAHRATAILAGEAAAPSQSAEVAARAEAAKRAALEVSSSPFWVLYEDPTVNSSDGGGDSSSPLPGQANPDGVTRMQAPVTVGPDEVIMEVEMFDQGGMPYNPALFRKFKAPASAVAAAAEARRSEAARPEVQSRVQAAQAAQRELESSGARDPTGNSWLLLEDFGVVAQRVLGPDQEIKAVELFTEEGAPYNPAAFQRYVKKKGDAVIVARMAEQQMATEAAARAAKKEHAQTPAQQKPKQPVSKHQPADGRKLLATAAASAVRRAQAAVAARAAAVRASVLASGAATRPSSVPRLPEVAVKPSSSTSDSSGAPHPSSFLPAIAVPASHSSSRYATGFSINSSILDAAGTNALDTTMEKSEHSSASPSHSPRSGRGSTTASGLSSVREPGAHRGVDLSSAEPQGDAIVLLAEAVDTEELDPVAAAAARRAAKEAERAFHADAHGQQQPFVRKAVSVSHDRVSARVSMRSVSRSPSISYSASGGVGIDVAQRKANAPDGTGGGRVLLSVADGVRDRVDPAGIRAVAEGEGEAAQVIGDLGMVGRSARRSPAAVQESPSHSVKQSTGGGRRGASGLVHGHAFPSSHIRLQHEDEELMDELDTPDGSLAGRGGVARATTGWSRFSTLPGAQESLFNAGHSALPSPSHRMDGGADGDYDLESADVVQHVKAGAGRVRMAAVGNMAVAAAAARRALDTGAGTGVGHRMPVPALRSTSFLAGEEGAAAEASIGGLPPRSAAVTAAAGTFSRRMAKAFMLGRDSPGRSTSDGQRLSPHSLSHDSASLSPSPTHAAGSNASLPRAGRPRRTSPPSHDNDGPLSPGSSSSSYAPSPTVHRQRTFSPLASPVPMAAVTVHSPSQAQTGTGAGAGRRRDTRV